MQWSIMMGYGGTRDPSLENDVVQVFLAARESKIEP